MVINDPATLAEVTAVFDRYEKALVGNDVATLDELFWQDERTIRYGGGENLYGVSEILAFRKGRPSAGLERDLERTVITTFGTDFATASTLFRRESATGKIGRQMQSWARMEDGWRVVAAHVSIIDEPA
ncbi:oxalurate catabolism protein HpxZ [Oricola sp.]|uniref:oxalurate catabolism protein HpxZ n=1 Tax=Oricola sp. TaxID=1979950 RepID=UPI0025EEDA8F|nr:oxalurate catabolism protein HpxZ [Oricola sp.]MCI5076151.1 oxalurate catabolism protein HpxZ [Oricola sp.]